ncbi:13864_t:CDS:2, partial [Gigaspora rosea]
MLNNDLEFSFEPCNGQRDSSNLNNNEFFLLHFLLHILISIHEQESTQLVVEQESDEESDCCDENNSIIIKVGAEFPKHDNNGAIFRQYFICENSKNYQPKKKTNNANHRERESKKVGYPWQLNVGEEFAPSLRTLSQDVLDEIKFLTQK